jgi:ATP-dependent DNA helicase RecQ
MVNDLPFMALTATATEQTKQRIFELLEFETPSEIWECPNKANIRYSVQKLDNSVPIIENFKSVINEIIEKGKNSTRRIIYCQTVKQCSHLFRMFELELESHLYVGEVTPGNRLIEMLHSGSPSTVKAHVLDQFGDSTKHLRILIATIAYGMGIDCKGVTQVIHFGPSQTIESYMQESGRCGRKGEQSDALLLYNGTTMKLADSDMKEYINSTTCRRITLLKPFWCSFYSGKKLTRTLVL